MSFAAIAIELGIEVGLWALNKYVLDDSKKLPRPQPDGLEFPQTAVDTPIPYMAGTVRVNPVLVWFGNAGATAVAGGRFDYRVDMLFAIGTPMWDSADAPWSNWRSAAPPYLRTLWYGEAKFPLTIGGTPVFHGNKGQVRIRPNGAVVLEAGVPFYDGRATQTIAGQLVGLKMAASGIDSANIPGYRHRMLVGVLATPGSYAVTQPNIGGIGNDPRVASVAVEVSAVGPQPIGLDANPAWVLYDILCRPVWGLGIDPDDVDLDSFQAAADTLVDEGHGCSVVVQQSEDAVRILSAIQSQVDGVLFESPNTGKIKFKLIRNDYDPDTIPLITADNTITRPTVDDRHERDCPNEVRVSFTARAQDYKRDTVPWKKEGDAASRGNQRRPTDFDAPGCMTAELAAKIAARELSVVGRPLRTIRIRVNREFYALELGDAVKVNLPQYEIDDEIYRVLEVDYGQIAAGAIEMRLIVDVFDQTVGGFVGDPPPDEVVDLLPLTTRVLDEAPYFWQELAVRGGYLASLGTQHLWAFAAAEGSPDPANRFLADTIAGGTTGYFGGFGVDSLPDVGPQSFPTTCTLAVAALRTAEPYDTVTGLVVENVAGEFAATFTDFVNDATRIANGYSLWLLGGENIVPGAGEGAAYQLGEVIAFESVTDLGGGQYQLVNVWRGLLDTAPRDWPIGTRLYHLRLDAVGQRDWTPDPLDGYYVRGTSTPLYKSTTGADGVDATDDILVNVLGRRKLALRAADLRARGYDLEGTAGVPSTTQTYPYLGDFKALTRLDGALDLSARQNKIAAGVVVRGDDDSWMAEAGTTWTVRLAKDGQSDAIDPAFAGLTTPAAQAVLLGAAGHGAIRVYLDSYGSSQLCWQSPAIAVDAKHYRNLLAHDCFDNGALSPAWTTLSGSPSVQHGANSLPRESTGRYWTQASGGAAIKQIVDVSGYDPIGLTALVTWYARGFGASGGDVTITLRALDASSSEITNVTKTTTGPTDHWRFDSRGIAGLPSGTARIAVEVSLDSGDAKTPGVTRVQLQIGQMSDELLTNPSFDGSLTGWTTVSGSWVVNTGNPYSSRNGTLGAAQGGTSASSELKQSASITAGYEYGVAVLTFARSTTITGDDGEVVLEALDGGGSVLDSVTTGAERPRIGGTEVLNIWQRRRLALQLPDGAATLRVRLLATRTAGSGNSGACFDDLRLQIHKDLDPINELDFDFRAPSWQKMPTTWQRFHLDYPTLPVPFLAWEGSSEVPSVRASHRLSGPTAGWSDSSHPDSATYVGFWDVGPHPLYPDPAQRLVTSTYAHQFTRATAGSAVDLQISGADTTTGDEYGAFELDEAFSVAIDFRTDEIAWSTAAGLVGRRDNSGHGWGIELDASGHLKAVLQGASSTATATQSGVAADRAPHRAVLVNNPATSKLRIYVDTGEGYAEVSTTGIGAITATATPLRVGRDGPASATGGVQIARVYIWDVALSAVEAAAIMQYGTDPSELLNVAALDKAVFVPGPEDDNGTTLIRYAANHTPIGSVGGRYGLITARSSTNKIPGHDFTDTGVWTHETNATLTQALVDNTGLPRGVRVTNSAADKGIICSGLTMGVGDPLSVVFFARTTDGVSRTLVVELSSTTPTVIDTDSVTLTGLWQRFHVTLSGWTNSTPTAKLRFVLGASATGSFDLAHPMWAAFGSDGQFAIQDAGALFAGSAGGRTAVDLPLQGNYEGEIYVEGACALAVQSGDVSFLEVDTDSNTEGSRVLATDASIPSFQLFDDGAVQYTAEPGADIDWSAGFVLRGRWCSLELPESLGDQIGIVITESSADDTDYQAAAFAVGTSPLNDIVIGGDPGHLVPNAVIYRAIVRTREVKLNG